MKYSTKTFDKCVALLIPSIAEANRETTIITRRESIRLVAEQFFSIDDYDSIPESHKKAYSVLRSFFQEIQKQGYFTFGDLEIDL